MGSTSFRIAYTILCCYIFAISHEAHANSRQFELSVTDQKIHLKPHNQHGGHRTFGVSLGLSLPPSLLRQVEVRPSRGGAVVELGDHTRLEVIEPAPECQVVSWSTAVLPELRDCIDYGTAQWFGGPEQWLQFWPVQQHEKQNYPYYTKNSDNMGVAERFWLSSEGIYIFVEPEIPLFIDSHASGDNQLCLVARFEEPYQTVGELTLRYHVCSLPTAREAHLHALNTVLQAWPGTPPEERIVRHPIWSTWARYKKDISEATVMQYANEIIAEGYNNAQLEIDDHWETCYGELQFDPVKFPDPARLTSQLRALGFRTTLWVHPFINSDCPLFETARQAGYFTSDKDGNIFANWWNGNSAGMIDFTNPEAAAWFVDRLRNLQNATGIESFKFDAGETGNLPNPVLQGDPRLQPNSYTTEYVRTVSQFGGMAEVRAGAGTQRESLWVRMLDKDSRWGLDNGLRSVVTSLLVMSFSGYHYVLPDMIGGNGYGSDVVTPELFVRWLQANVFMPALQFSYVPWDFNDTEVKETCRAMVALHEVYADEILLAAEEARNGTWPLNSPIWYADELQSDQTAFSIADEFLLGRRLLVAPVLEEGATSRDVYLPSGRWRDLTTAEQHQGPVWLRDYPAPLSVLPHFELLTSHN